MKAHKAMAEFYPCTVAKNSIDKSLSVSEAWDQCQIGAWMLWLLYHLKPHNIDNWSSTEEHKRARRAARDTSIPGTPAQRIRTVVTGLQVAKLVTLRAKTA